MTDAEWLGASDPEPMVRSLRAESHQRELRLFAIACVRRTWDILPEHCRAAVIASERFANGEIAESELAAIITKADLEAQSLCSGCAPDAREYAASAAVDASSIWPRTTSNVLASTTCTASAIAWLTAEADQSRYDEVFDLTWMAELAVQACLLRSLVRYPPQSDPA